MRIKKLIFFLNSHNFFTQKYIDNFFLFFHRLMTMKTLKKMYERS